MKQFYNENAKLKAENKHLQEQYNKMINLFIKEEVKNIKLRDKIQDLKDENKKLGEKELQLMIINFQVIGDLKKEIKELKGKIK